MKLDIMRIATLANLPLTDDEKKKLEPQLVETLTYIKELEGIDTTNITPTSQVTGLENVLAADKARPSLSQKEALSNTKITENGYFKVKGIFDEK